MDKQKILKDLETFMSIQSVSADSARFPEILMAVEFLKRKLTKMGFKVRVLKNGTKPPLVVASKIVDKKNTTIGIYGHYDVQPEDPVNEWKSKPFKLTLRDGKFFGRGVADNKGHIIQNIAALELLINEGKLKNNIIFILEGEEESGSINLQNYLERIKDDLKQVDLYFVTDLGMQARNIPLIFYALRGLVYFELEVKIGEKDLHSGIYGNQVLNPLHLLSELFTKIKDSQTGEILIPHFYDEVREVNKDELELLKKVEESNEDLKDEASVYEVKNFRGNPSHVVSKIYPSFDICGIIGGYTGEGAKTIIPNSAKAKFSFRLVEYQKTKDIVQLVKTFIKNNLPHGVKYSLHILSFDEPFYMDINNEHIKKVAKILTEHFAQETLFDRSGGSIPVAEILQRLCKKPIILTGFTLDDDNIHSPNENFDEEMFWEGIEVLKMIYSSI